MRLDAEIVVACIMPSADVETGNGFTRLVFGQRGWSLVIAIEMEVARRGHARIVEMASAMPHAVLLFDAHVAHLNRKEMLEHRLPDPALEYVW